MHNLEILRLKGLPFNRRRFRFRSEASSYQGCLGRLKHNKENQNDCKVVDNNKLSKLA